jgi:transposase
MQPPNGFGVSVASAVRWLRSWRDEGAKAAKPRGGDRHSHRIEAFGEVILGAIAAQTDITLVELSELLQREHGARFAPSTIWRFGNRRGLSFKKNRARGRAGQARRRRAASRLVRRPA